MDTHWSGVLGGAGAAGAPAGIDEDYERLHVRPQSGSVTLVLHGGFTEHTHTHTHFPTVTVICPIWSGLVWDQVSKLAD